MARSSNSNVLDQIAKFFLLLSDAPLYWFTLNTTMTAMIDDDDNDDGIRRRRATAMAEAARASSIQRRALIGSWVTLPTTGAIEIERGGDENITINHGCRQGEAGRQAARRQ